MYITTRMKNKNTYYPGYHEEKRCYYKNVSHLASKEKMMPTLFCDYTLL